MNNKQAEDEIKSGLGKQYPVDSVSCPGDVSLKKGEKFECKAKFTGGDEFLVKAEITDVKDNVGSFSYQVGEPFFDPKSAAAWIADELLKQTNTPAKVDCGALRKPKANDTCIAEAPDGSKVTVSITVDPATGKTQGFEVK